MRKCLGPAPFSRGESSLWQLWPGAWEGDRLAQDATASALPGWHIPRPRRQPWPSPISSWRKALAPRWGQGLPPLGGGTAPSPAGWPTLESLGRSLFSSEGGCGGCGSCVEEAQGVPGLCDPGLEFQSPMFGRNFEIQTEPCPLILQKGKLRPRGFPCLMAKSSQWLGGS